MKLSILLLFSAIICTQATLPKIRFEYKYSFKGPHLVQKDRTIPFWEYHGDTIASDDNIRITPSLRSKKGSVWTKNVASFEHFSIEVVFKVTGRGRVGADGLAIWFTEMKGIEGPVFGSNDYWKGLGIFFDSFDNDGQHNNPYILAMVNDGTKAYNHQNDGIEQQLGGCLRDFRNKPFPVRVKIEYYEKVLTVFFNSGLTNNKDDFEMCLRSENIELPKSGYFGMSAATGGLADDHDALAFLTHSLIPPGQETQAKVDDVEKKQYEEEFKQYYDELEKAKKEYQHAHPDEAGKPGYEDPESAFEQQADRELRMIFEGQNLIHQTLKEITRRFDELTGRQELVLSRVTQMSGGAMPPAAAAATGKDIPPSSETYNEVLKYDISRLVNIQHEIRETVKQSSSQLMDITQRASLLESNIGKLSILVHDIKDVQPSDAQLFIEVQENLRTVKSDTSNLLSRPVCPTSCVSPVLFLLAIGAQLAILIGYMVYKQNKEAQAKKFF